MNPNDRVEVCCGRLDGSVKATEEQLAEDSRRGVVSTANRASARVRIGGSPGERGVWFPKIMLKPV